MNDRDDSSGSSEEDVLDVAESTDDDGAVFRSPKRSKAAGSTPIIVHSSFDAYFTQTAARPQTSNSVFSSIIPPLSTEEYTETISDLDKSTKQPLTSDIVSNPSLRNALFSRLVLQLKAKFNILCYGYGSKRHLINQFAVERCAKMGHVVVVNGFHPDCGGVKEVVRSIENNVTGLSSLPLPSGSSSIDLQIQRICQFYTGDSAHSKTKKRRHLYIVIHNVDSNTLRSVKSQSLLSTLASSPGIHLIASVDHINAPLIWSSSQLSSRGSHTDSFSPFSKGFNWIWTDLTTLAPYDFELTFADRTSISGAHDVTSRKNANSLATSLANAAVSETAALHVLASVTEKAKRLFALMGGEQLKSMREAASQESGATSDDSYWHQFAITYSALTDMARNEFLATNDTQLRALLGEFRDHNLIVGSQGGSAGELLWIPARKDRLEKILEKAKG
ncbi:origin recognition complex subunit 2 [Marasmius fiardii PR-910]|nr:origin recognition complex subunit 2 [Marasmius fiardii PR-910]